MKPLRIVISGVFGLAIAAIGSSVWANEPKLCIQVVAVTWSKKHNAPPDMYIRQNAEFLHMPGATDKEFNEAWQKWMTDTYAKDHTAAETAQWMEAFRKRASCNSHGNHKGHALLASMST